MVEIKAEPSSCDEPVIIDIHAPSNNHRLCSNSRIKPEPSSAPTSPPHSTTTNGQDELYGTKSDHCHSEVDQLFVDDSAFDDDADVLADADEILVSEVPGPEGRLRVLNVNDCFIFQRLWENGEMGAGNPSALLLAMWHFISKYFHIIRRQDHWRLCLGHLELLQEKNSIGNYVWCLRFINFQNLVTPNSPPSVLYEIPGSSRCPVALFRTYLNHRPPATNFPQCPFYLQPFHLVDLSNPLATWFMATRLGKNKIGGLLNMALKKWALPSVRFVTRENLINSSHFEAPSFADSLEENLFYSSRRRTRTPAVANYIPQSETATLNKLIPFRPILPKPAYVQPQTEICVIQLQPTPQPPFQIQQQQQQQQIVVPNYVSEASTAIPTTVPTTISPKKGESGRRLSKDDDPAVDFHVSDEDLTPQRRYNLRTKPTPKYFTSSDTSGDEKEDEDSPEVSPTSLIRLRTLKRIAETQRKVDKNAVSSRQKDPTSHYSKEMENLESNHQLKKESLSISNSQTTAENEELMDDVMSDDESSHRSEPVLNSTKLQLQPKVRGDPNAMKEELKNLLQGITCDEGETDIASSSKKMSILTCILHNVGAISADHPLLLSFSMWWLVHNYFGIGSIQNQVRLRWRHFHLLEAVPPHSSDVTEKQECVEYCGPKEFLTKDVYQCKRMFSDTPTRLAGKPGPDFVALYKTYMSRRPTTGCQHQSRFYLHPVSDDGQNYADMPCWYNSHSMSQDRVSSLLRLVIERVVAKYSECTEMPPPKALNTPTVTRQSCAASSSSSSDDEISIVSAVLPKPTPPPPAPVAMPQTAMFSSSPLILPVQNTAALLQHPGLLNVLPGLAPALNLLATGNGISSTPLLTQNTTVGPPVQQYFLTTDASGQTRLVPAVPAASQAPAPQQFKIVQLNPNTTILVAQPSNPLNLAFTTPTQVLTANGQISIPEPQIVSTCTAKLHPHESTTSSGEVLIDLVDSDEEEEKKAPQAQSQEDNAPPPSSVPDEIEQQYTENETYMCYMTLAPENTPTADKFISMDMVLKNATERYGIQFLDSWEKLWSQGVLGVRNAWCLNFTAYMVNQLAFNVRDVNSHMAILWGDVKLGCIPKPHPSQPQLGGREFLHFVNSCTKEVFFLLASDPAEEPQVKKQPARCPVYLYKFHARHRPPSRCTEDSRYYLQPRRNSSACEEAMGCGTGQNFWFNESAWSRNKISAIVQEATSLAGLPEYWLTEGGKSEASNGLDTDEIEARLAVSSPPCITLSDTEDEEDMGSKRLLISTDGPDMLNPELLEQWRNYDSGTVRISLEEMDEAMMRTESGERSPPHLEIVGMEAGPRDGSSSIAEEAPQMDAFSSCPSSPKRLCIDKDWNNTNSSSEPSSNPPQESTTLSVPLSRRKRHVPVKRCMDESSLPAPSPL